MSVNSLPKPEPMRKQPELPLLTPRSAAILTAWCFTIRRRYDPGEWRDVDILDALDVIEHQIQQRTKRPLFVTEGGV